MSFYDVYYQQYGGGGRGVHNVFVGAPRQKGHGLGSFFTGLFRSALPFLAKGARAVGKEALRAGVNMLDDIGENNMTFKESFKNRMNESGRNLKRKAVDKVKNMMQGSGYKTLNAKRRRQSGRVSATRRIFSKSQKKRSKGIKRGRVSKRNKNNKTKRKNNKKLKSVKSARRLSAKKSKKQDIFD